jgi:hypothetical protein
VPGPDQLYATGGTRQVELSWSAPFSNGRSPITGYDVFVGTKAGHESSRPVNRTPLSRHATGFAVRDLRPGTTYYVVVKAINAVGRGARSNEVHARAR